MNVASKDGSINIDTKIDDKGLSEGVKKVQTKLNDIADSVNSTAEKFSSLTVPMTALGGGALKVASDFDGSMVHIQNALGLTGEEAKALQDTVQEVWKKGFGESLDEVSNAAIQVKQNMKGLDNGYVEKATKNALLLAQTYESDVNEVTRAANSLMQNFGLTGEEAFDKLANGAKNGMNFSNEMFDNLSEYTINFQEAGFAVDEMFSMLTNGAKKGYNLDRLNDSILEFKLQTEDSSKAYTDAMKLMDKDTQKVFKQYKDGEADVSDVYKSVVAGLEKMKGTISEKDFNTIGKALFGTKWEDQGADVIMSMKTINDEMGNSKGTMDEMTKNHEGAFGVRFQNLLRTAADALRPLGNTLMDIAERVMPYVIKAIESLSKWFEGLSPHVQTIITVLGILVAAAGPVLTAIGFMVGAISNLVPIIATVWGWFKKLAGIFNLIKTAMFLLGGPATIAIGILVAAALWVWQNWDMVSKWLVAAWEWVKEMAVVVWTALSTFFSELWTSITTTIKTVWEVIKVYFSVLWTSIKVKAVQIFTNIATFLYNTWTNITNTVKSIWNGIKTFLSNLWNGIKNTVKTIFTTIRDTISSIFDNVWSKISSIWSTIKTFITNTASNIWTTIKNNFQNVVDSVKEKMDKVLSKVKEIWGYVTDFFEGIDLGKIGKNIIQGLIDGIGSMKDFVIDIIEDTVGSAIDFAKKLLGIKSPSRVFMEMGEFTGEGYEIGVDKSLKGVLASAKRLANTAIQPFASQPIATVAENAAIQATNIRQQKQPAIINLRMGNRDYRTFVKDITEMQNLHSNRLNRFKGGAEYAI